MTFKLQVGDPIPVAELIKKPSGGRPPSERDLALVELVQQVAQPENKDVAIAWEYGDEKTITARSASNRAIVKAGLKGKVFASVRDGKVYFSQTPISNRGRKKT